VLSRGFFKWGVTSRGVLHCAINIFYIYFEIFIIVFYKVIVFPEESEVSYIIKYGCVLMAYTILAGALLAFVYIKTAPLIEAQKLASTGDSVRAVVLPGMDGGFEQVGDGTGFTYWNGYRDAGKKTPGGYVFIVYGKGYSSTIETMIGIDIDGTITGAKVLAQKETPGLGDKVEEIKPGEKDPWFTRQFVGKPASFNFNVTKDGGGIDAITGATISSRAIATSIIGGIKSLLDTTGGGAFTRKIETAEAAAGTEKGAIAFKIPEVDEVKDLIPGMAGGYELHGEDTVLPYWTGYTDIGKTKPGGYIFIAFGGGFASTIATAVGVDTGGVIRGVKVLSHEETPGYGDKIGEIRNGETAPWFPRQFIGKKATDTISLVQDGGTIDALSEATITSAAVTKSIAEGIKLLMDVVSGKAVAPLAQAPAGESAVESPVSTLSEDILMEVLPNVDGGYELNDENDFVFWIGYADMAKTEPAGFVFVAMGVGYASTIATAVGVDAEGTIAGIKVLSHKETPGYDDKLDEVRDGETAPWFPRQFIGKKATDTIALRADGGDIDAMTEATITSKAVTESVSSGIKKLMEAIEDL